MYLPADLSPEIDQTASRCLNFSFFAYRHLLLSTSAPLSEVSVDSNSQISVLDLGFSPIPVSFETVLII